MLYCDRRPGGDECWVSGDPRDASMRIADAFLQCVTFLCSKSANGNLVWRGTAFLIDIDSLVPRGTETFLVTAKHCLFDKHGKRIDSLYLRANVMGGGLRNVKITSEWYFPDDASDVVVTFPVPDDSLALQVLPPRMILDDNAVFHYRIGIGDEIYVSGLYTQHSGTKKNLPIIKTGIIAGMPSEPIRTADGIGERGYLAEIRSIGGLSGSPVFVWLDNERALEEMTARRTAVIEGKLWPKRHVADVGKGTHSWNPGVMFLLGLIRGHWEPRFTIKGEIQNLNEGITVITPIQDAIAVINGPEMKKARLKRMRAAQRENGLVLD